MGVKDFEVYTLEALNSDGNNVLGCTLTIAMQDHDLKGERDDEHSGRSMALSVLFCQAPLREIYDRNSCSSARRSREATLG